MQNSFEILEIGKIEEALAFYARTERGKKSARDLKILPLEDLKKELSFLKEAFFVIPAYGNLPLDVSSDLETTVDLAKKGHVLNAEELERVAHDIKLSKELERYFQKVLEAPLLSSYVASLPDLGDLEKEIHKVIAPNLTIYDNASPKLKAIRVAIAKLEKEMVAKLGFVLQENKIYLSDTTLTIKNGHYVLPVANAYKNKVKGIVQDVSKTGETTFIEPALLVEMNNQMTILQNNEREEIHRLLAILSGKVAGRETEVKVLNAAIGYLDFLQAKILYGESLEAHLGNVSEDGTLSLIRARHPLLDQSKVVPNDFSMSPSRRLVVISGPNAGGKTVALKTVGTLVYMFQAGLLIPASEGAEIPYFKHIFLDIGDSQSIEDSLSTFSGHISGIASICERVGGKDLVLLDEVGTGTSPEEGEALAYAIIRYLLSKHCYTLLSSHFKGIKAFALTRDDIENASMLFDEGKLAPTYRLAMGLPGDSYGLVAAKRFGLQEDIVKDASSYLSEHTDFSVSSSIKKLGALTKENEDLKAELSERERKLRAKEEEFQKKEEAYKEKQKRFLQDANDEKRRLIEETEDKLNEILASLNGKSSLKPHEVTAAKKSLDDLIEAPQSSHFEEKIVEGDYVELPDYGVHGLVSRIKGNRLYISSKGKEFSAPVSAARKIDPPIEKSTPMRGSVLDQTPTSGLSLECNLIGMRVEEALSVLDKYLDSCRLKGFKRVRIVHGFGSGALRKATHEYLKKHSSFVEKYEIAGEHEGSGGATVVYLK